jgi:hypothetical protein
MGFGYMGSVMKHKLGICSLVGITACILGCAGVATSPNATNYTPEPDLTTPATSADVLSRMRVKHDGVDEVDWYHPKEDMYFKATGMDRPGKSRFMPYVGQSSKGGPPTIHIDVTYIGPNWIFASRMTVVADEKRFDFDNLEFDRSVLSGDTVFEEVFTVLRPDDLAMMQAIASAQNATVRLRGEHGHSDIELTSTDQLVVADILTLFAKLGGQLPPQ